MNKTFVILMALCLLSSCNASSTVGTNEKQEVLDVFGRMLDDAARYLRVDAGQLRLPDKRLSLFKDTIDLGSMLERLRAAEKIAKKEYYDTLLTENARNGVTFVLYKNYRGYKYEVNLIFYFDNSDSVNQVSIINGVGNQSRQ